MTFRDKERLANHLIDENPDATVRDLIDLIFMIESKEFIAKKYLTNPKPITIHDNY